MIRTLLYWTGMMGVVSGIVLGLSACSFSKPFPKKSVYRLYPVEAPELNQPSKGRQVVSINTFGASEEFDGKGFVYRLEGQKFEADFYNEWLTQPKAAVTEWVRRALVEKGPFSAAVDPSSRLKPDLRIEGRILEWFADFSQPAKPEVVVALEIRWMRLVSEDVFSSGTKTYHQRVPTSSSDPGALVAAWQEAMESIMGVLLQDLKPSDSWNF